MDKGKRDKTKTKSKQNIIKKPKIIEKLINGRLSYLKSYNGYNLTVNLIYLKVVINYFNKFKLKTKRFPGEVFIREEGTKFNELTPC